MALIGNKSILNRVVGQQFGAGVSYMYPEALTPVGSKRNRFYGGYPQYTSTPNAYLHPMALVLPKISGGIATNNQAEIVIAQTTSVLVNAQYISGTSTITLTNVNAQLGQIFAAAASSTITVAQFAATLKALVSGSAAGTITFAMSSALLGGKFPGAGTSTITVTPSGLLTATAFMEAIAGGATPLSPEGLAAAVLLSEIESGYNLQEALRLILSANAGKVSGAATATVTIRNVTDDKNRIVATVDASGNRTAITYDVGD